MIFDSPWFALPSGVGMFFFLYFLGKGIGSYFYFKGKAFMQFVEKEENN